MSISLTLSPPPPLAAMLERPALFLDLDGTLLDLVDRPQDVVADAELRALLRKVDAALEGRVAVVSGRSLAQIDGILGDMAAGMTLSGSHGSEHRWGGIDAHPARPPALESIAATLNRKFAGYEGVLIEEKSFGVALHYRLAPEMEALAAGIMQALAEEHGLLVQPGKMMVELRVPGGDKGRAVRRLMSREPMAGTTPVFVGDDVTDEAGFRAAGELGGFGILVGAPRDTLARYMLPDPKAVHAWLREIAA